MQYSELVTAVQDYVENTFSTDQINLFIQQAEQRIFNSVQLPDLRKNVTGSTSPNIKYLSCPNDFLSVYSLAVIDSAGGYSYLLNKDVNYIREAYPSPSSTGLPRFYAIFGPQSVDPLELSLILGPTPDDAYTVELHYFSYPESIVTAGRSWLGDNFDSALLWGTIVEAYLFLKGESDLIATYQKRYDDAMGMLRNLGNGKNRGDAYRNGQYRTPAV